MNIQQSAVRIGLALALNEKFCDRCIYNLTGDQCAIYDQFLAGFEPEEISYQSGVSCTAWEAIA